MSPRVLSVVHGPVYGGGHSQMIRLREPLEERGYSTLGLVPTEPGNARARLEEAGVETVALPLGRLRASFRPAPHVRLVCGLPREVRAIRRLIRERGIDLVQVHGPTNPHAAIAARLEGVPTVWQLYEMRTPMIARCVTMPMVLGLASVLMSTGEAVARQHPGALRARDRLVTYVPPVDLDEFRPDPERRRTARAELGVSDDTLLIGTVGNLNPDKGHEFLVEAAMKVLQARPDVAVRVLGGSSPAHAAHEARIRAEAAPLGQAIRFVDPGSRVAELLPALDLFVLASRREGIPTVVLEAMACELPVITTDVGAVREVVDHGRTGLVVPTRDVQTLASAIIDLIHDADRRRAFAEEGRRSVTEHFGIERCADDHATAYRMALG